MKKTLLLIVCVAVATLTNATHNPFEKNKQRQQVKQKMKMENSFPLKSSAKVENVPTLIKQSNWDAFNSSWSPMNAVRLVYSNDLLVRNYQLNYAQTDTTFRSTATYNANKQIIQSLGEQKIAGVYIPNYRYSITYSNNNLKQIAVGETWEQSTQSWILFSRATEEFNSRGEQTKYVYEQNNNGVWEIQFGYSSQYTYLNSSSNKITEWVDSSYSFNSMRFEADDKEVRTYNANGEVIDILSYYNMGSGLKIFQKDSIFYTAGLPTKLIGYEYDSLTNTFNRTLKLDNIVWANFDPTIDLYFNEPIAFIASAWQNNAWQLEERNTTTFTDNFGSYLSLTEVYNSNNVWVNESRYKDVYDSKLNLIESLGEDYIVQTNTWETVYGEKNFLQYNMSNFIIERINERFNNSNNAYEKTNKFEFADFITIASGINTSRNIIEVKLYPNPSADGRVSVNVKMEVASALNIKITDLKGSVVYTDKKELGKGLNTVEMSGLQQGMYIVEMSSEYGVARTKLVIN